MTDPAAWGVAASYEDAAGRRHRAPDTTIDAVLAALGADNDPPPPPPVLTVSPGEHTPLAAAAELILEDGTHLGRRDELPPDLPIGYHRLVGPGDRDRLLIAAPPTCYLPSDLRAWGWAVQLYALRSSSSWGMGDLRDLRLWIQTEHAPGGEVTMINPLHAANPGLTQEPSPYFPSSRCYHNPLYIAVEEVPGAAEVTELEELSAAGRALNSDRRIDRDRVFRLKQEALERIFAHRVDDPAFERFRAKEGDLLESYATFAALYEQHQGSPRTWPSEHRHPASATVARWREKNEWRVRFHSWQQWLLARQLEAAGEGTRLICDLAVGVDPDGADAWIFQDTFAPGISVGAPPDTFNSAGQDWGVLAFDPFALARAGYGPFIRTVRAALSAGGGLRMDHVMGLWRLYWIPSDASPRAGTYVRYPTRELLAVLALESARARAFIVGEDLGTVERGVSAELVRRHVLCTRLLWFEDDVPELSVAAVGNHDLPTVAGLWTGEDLTQQARIGRPTDPVATAALRKRLARAANLVEGASVKEAVDGAYRVLARLPSRIVMAQLEDALEVSERVNMPGTTREWPNWSLALPLQLEEIAEHAEVESIARLLDSR